jgi:hypothetical protein
MLDEDDGDEDMDELAHELGFHSDQDELNEWMDDLGFGHDDDENDWYDGDEVENDRNFFEGNILPAE